MMAETTIAALKAQIGNTAWTMDFDAFCAVTGFKGLYAEQKFAAFQRLAREIDGFDAATLAKILNGGK